MRLMSFCIDMPVPLVPFYAFTLVYGRSAEAFGGWIKHSVQWSIKQAELSALGMEQPGAHAPLRGEEPSTESRADNFRLAKSVCSAVIFLSSCFIVRSLVSI